MSGFNANAGGPQGLGEGNEPRPKRKVRVPAPAKGKTARAMQRGTISRRAYERHAPILTIIIGHREPDDDEAGKIEAAGDMRRLLSRSPRVRPPTRPMWRLGTRKTAETPPTLKQIKAFRGGSGSCRRPAPSKPHEAGLDHATLLHALKTEGPFRPA